jgi:hypothetical protein
MGERANTYRLKIIETAEREDEFFTKGSYMNFLKSLSSQQKLYVLVLFICILPTIGVLLWGVYKASQSSEFHTSVWDQPKPTIAPPLGVK